MIDHPENPELILESELPIQLDKNKEVKNKGDYKQLTKGQWAQVRVEWERGETTAKKLSEKYGIKLSTLQQKVSRNKWVKGKVSEVIQGNIAERNKIRFVNAGCSPQKAIELIARGMSEPTMVLFEGKGDNMIATPAPDFKLRLDYLKEYNKLCGRYAPLEKEADKHVHFHVSEQKMQEMTASEAIQAYQQLQDLD